MLGNICPNYTPFGEKGAGTSLGRPLPKHCKDARTQFDPPRDEEEFFLVYSGNGGKFLAVDFNLMEIIAGEEELQTEAKGTKTRTSE